MDFIISLAHFCEIHGPTSILCTQVLPISCLTCSPLSSETATIPQPLRDTSSAAPPSPSLEKATNGQDPYLEPRIFPTRRPSSEPHTRNPSFSRRSHNPPVSQKSALLNQHLQHELESYRSLDSTASLESLSPPFQSPPGSPRSTLASETQYSGSLGNTEAARRYGGSGLGAGTSSPLTDTCPNCTLSLPKSVSEQLPEDAPGSPTRHGRGQNGSPVLRTREAFKASPTPDARSSSSETSPDRSESSSPDHKHTLTYLTTRQPASMTAHALLRRSCIRTLSCEQLPRANKGPIFFGDDTAGYTISYIFRLSDSSARGRSRRYAFICWAGREERRAARAWKEVSAMFEGMVGWMEELVERREQRTRLARGPSSASPKTSPDLTPVSSFLSGRTVDPDGYSRRSDVQAKGLADVVGKEDFFVDVHAVFVRLLTRLGRTLGGWPMGTVLDAGIRGEVGELRVTEEQMRKFRIDRGSDPADEVDDSTRTQQPLERSRTYSNDGLGDPTSLAGLKGSPSMTPSRLESGPRQAVVA